MRDSHTDNSLLQLQYVKIDANSGIFARDLRKISFRGKGAIMSGKTVAVLGATALATTLLAGSGG